MLHDFRCYRFALDFLGFGVNWTAIRELTSGVLGPISPVGETNRRRGRNYRPLFTEPRDIY